MNLHMTHPLYLYPTSKFKGVVYYFFFLCMIVFMGCNITCLLSLIFHELHLYCKPISSVI